jgi:hypothetical protein
MEDQWYRIGLNGFLAHIGDFKNDYSDDNRWKLFQQMGYELKPERETNKFKPIVIVLQLPGDASLCGHDISEWCIRTVRSIRSVTDRKIIIRKPQVEREYRIAEALDLFDNVDIQEGKHENVKSTIQAAHALVTFSSGMGVEALIEGTPVIAHHQASFVYDITPNKIEDIENIKLPDRKQWINDMAYTTWSLEEIGKGLPWKHLTKVELRSIRGH